MVALSDSTTTTTPHSATQLMTPTALSFLLLSLSTFCLGLALLALARRVVRLERRLTKVLRIAVKHAS